MSAKEVLEQNVISGSGDGSGRSGRIGKVSGNRATEPRSSRPPGTLICPLVPSTFFALIHSLLLFPLQREQAQFASKQREGDENILKAERLRRAEFYSSRAHERFNDALRKEQATHAAEQEREDFLGNRLKQHRKMENQMALIRRVNFRECKESVQTVEPPIIHQVPMARPHGIPHPIDPSFVDLKETSALSSPFSGKVNEFDGIVREVTTIAVDEALRSPIWGGGALGGPGRENLTSDYEIADVDDVVSVGSIVSLNDAYMEPVSSRDAVTRGTEPGNSFRERMVSEE